MLSYSYREGYVSEHVVQAIKAGSCCLSSPPSQFVHQEQDVFEDHERTLTESKEAPVSLHLSRLLAESGSSDKDAFSVTLVL